MTAGWTNVFPTLEVICRRFDANSMERTEKSRHRSLDVGRLSDDPPTPKMELVSSRHFSNEDRHPPLLQLLAKGAVRSVVGASLQALLFIPTGGGPFRPRR